LLSPIIISVVRPLMMELLSLRCVVSLLVELLSSSALDFLDFRDFFLALKFASDSFLERSHFA
jgi:hypothetical protein